MDDEVTLDDYKLPQRLCKMCGRCCKAIIPEYSYEELENMLDQKERQANVFLEIFNRYPSIEEARKVVPEQVDQVLENLSAVEGYDESKISFYYCPHITDKNMCSIHLTRPDCCRLAPRHGWSLMPPGCGFEGWQFKLRERVKKSIRLLKEYLYESQILYGENQIPGKNMTTGELEELINKKIEPWIKYGSKFW